MIGYPNCISPRIASFVRVSMMFAVAWMGLASTCRTQDVPSESLSGSSSCNGNQPYPCSRTDFLIVQNPAPPSVGNLTGAGTVVTDPDFGRRIERVTDANSTPDHLNFTYSAGMGGSADVNVFNLDSSLFLVEDQNGAFTVYSLDASTLNTARLYPTNAPDNGLRVGGAGWFSWVNSQVFYDWPTLSTKIQKYDVTDRTHVPSPTTVYDFASSSKCLGAGFKPTWRGMAGAGAGDTMFAAAFSNAGVQDTAIYVVAYKAGSGCTMWNTKTGAITGDWGATGTAKIRDRFKVHNAKISKDGNWVVVTIASNGCLSTATCAATQYFWQIGTTTVTYCKTGVDMQCSGHWTTGFQSWVNFSAAASPPVGPGPMQRRGFTTPGTFMNLMHVVPAAWPPVASWDNHFSWNNVAITDDSPVLWTVSLAPAPPVPLLFTSAWQNEVIATAGNGSSTTWRFAHTFNSGQGPSQFSTQYAITAMSQDGRFALMSSDWLGALGSTSGTASCTLGTNCRGDVFIVELK